jgi:hypothetical protein
MKQHDQSAEQQEADDNRHFSEQDSLVALLAWPDATLPAIERYALVTAFAQCILVNPPAGPNNDIDQHGEESADTKTIEALSDKGESVWLSLDQ